MEKITYLPNGQWELAKGVPTKPGSYDGGRGYGLDLTDSSGVYTGKDLDRMVDAGFKSSSDTNKARVKKMINSDTGKPEDHLLVHFGMGGDIQNNLSQDLNNFKLHEDGHVGVVGNQGALVSGDPEFSAGFASGNKGSGHLLSFWVPRSKIAHMNSHPFQNVSGYSHMNREQRNKFITDSIDSHSGDEYDPKAEGKAYTHSKFHNNTVNQEQGDSQAGWHDFTRIHPGKYKPATLDEVKASFQELKNKKLLSSNANADDISNLHTKTHGLGSGFGKI